MKLKYEIRLRRAGDQYVYTLATVRNLIPTRGWFNRKIDVEEATYFWRKSGDEDGRDLHLDRDTARFILSNLMAAKHQERTAWITHWDLLKMFACIPVTDTRVYEEKETRFVKLEHVKNVFVELHDFERDFTVFSQELDYFTSQGLRLQD